MKWCFIGTGKIANKAARAILSSGRHEIVSCYTRSFEKAKEFAERYHTTAYETAEEAMLASDAVYVSTTHNVHFPFAKQAISLHKPALIEKAFTMNAEEAKELIDLARKEGVYLAEGMWTWFSPCANEVLRWVKDGAIGKIKKAKFTYHLNSIHYAPRVSDPRRGGGALLDVTVYPITYAYRLFGKPNTIESRGVIKNGIDEKEDVLFTYDDFTVSISASIVDMKGLENMTIFGSKGKITSPFYHSTTKATLYKGLFQKTKFKGGKGNNNTLLTEFDNVANEIEEGLKESRFVPLDATYEVMQIMDEVARQIGLKYDNLE